MEKRAKSVELAVEEALKELNTTKDNVDIEIISEGSKGLFGIGAKDAVVKVTLKNSTAPAPKKAAPSKKAAKKVDSNPEAEAQKFLGDIFKAMDLDVKITASMQDDTVLINLEGDNMGIVIGKRGDTLDSLQYLTSLVVNQKSDDYIKVSIDTENYREKRTEALLALSKRLADKVERSGRKFTLEPMNPYERRIIHANLQDNEAVTTYSIGQEPYRKVVIAPKNPKPRKNTSRKPRYHSRHNDAKYDNTVTEDSIESIAPEKKGSYTTTYKADFKPQQHKAQYSSFEDYLAAQEAAKKGE